MTSKPQLSAKAMAAAQAGNIIQAIKIVREETGVGLKEAKDWVEQALEGRELNVPSPTPQNLKVPLKAVMALQQGQLLKAITYFEEQHKIGLKNSKDAINTYLMRNPTLQHRFREEARKRAQSAMTRTAMFIISLGVFLTVVYLWPLIMTYL